MGTLAPSMREAYIKKFGKQKWNEHVRVIDEMWSGIQQKIQQMNFSYKKVKVYQDGLPVCGMEKQIIADLAKKGSPNHKLVQWMMRKGATLVGTEDPKLLLEEYHHIRQITQAKTHHEREKRVHEFEEQSAELLQKRDKKMSAQIGSTLKKGETGVLFIGLLHRVDEWLAKDIRTSYLIHRLPFWRSLEMKKGA
ncbi:MAG: hypothetical protein HYU97_08045 [Deltaproteobacteria bacterium]|nr:hypothetical protein [Deltaproteobacteria bacterium]